MLQSKQIVELDTTALSEKVLRVLASDTCTRPTHLKYETNQNNLKTIFVPISRILSYFIFVSNLRHGFSSISHNSVRCT